jgi:hypothetical protein
MKRFILFLSFNLAFVSFAHAENRLFPTDILNKGEVDAQGSVDHQTYSDSIISNGNPGDLSFNETVESVQIRYGLGANWQAGASLNYNSKYETDTNYSNPPSSHVNTSNEGRQNPGLWLRYGIINDNSSPFSLSGQFLVRPNMADRSSTYTDTLSAGWKTSDTLRLYGTTALNTSTNTNNRNSINFSFGAYKDISENITLVPHAGYTKFQASTTYSPVSQYQIGLSSDIQISHNTYLIPAYSWYQNSAGDSFNGTLHKDAVTNGNNISLTLYHLF